MEVDFDATDAQRDSLAKSHREARTRLGYWHRRAELGAEHLDGIGVSVGRDHQIEVGEHALSRIFTYEIGQCDAFENPVGHVAMFEDVSDSDC